MERCFSFDLGRRSLLECPSLAFCDSSSTWALDLLTALFLLLSCFLIPPCLWLPCVQALLVPRSGPQFLDRGPSHVESRCQVLQGSLDVENRGLGRFHDFCSSRMSPWAAGMRRKTALLNSEGETCDHQVAGLRDRCLSALRVDIRCDL